MKKLYFIFLIIFSSSLMIAQTPQGINFQTLVRDLDNHLLTTQNITFRISIIKGNANGNTVYQETHNTTTDLGGLANITIGKGNIISGNFDQIDWSSGNYLIKTETDPKGGTNYSYTATQQIFSSVYTLYAENTGEAGETGKVGNYITSVEVQSDSIKFLLSNQSKLNIKNTGGIQGTSPENIFYQNDSIFVDLSNKTKQFAGTENQYKHFIGEQFGGGIIYYLYKDVNDEEHGLIVSINEFYSQWCKTQNFSVSAGASSSYDGKNNTTRIMNMDKNDTTNAAWVCNNYTGGGFNDWYLPAWDEFELLINEFYRVNLSLSNIPNTDVITDQYWMSTEALSYPTEAYMYNIVNGANQKHIKSTYRRVRPIRSF